MSDPSQLSHKLDFPPLHLHTVRDKQHSSVDTEGGPVSNPPVQAPDRSPIDGGSPTAPPDLNIPQSIPEGNKVPPTTEPRATLSAPSNEEQKKVLPEQAEVTPDRESRSTAVTPSTETPADSSDLTRPSGGDTVDSIMKRFMADPEKFGSDAEPEAKSKKKKNRAPASNSDQAKKVLKDKPGSEVKIGNSLSHPYQWLPPEVFLPTYDIPDVMSKKEWLTQQPDDVGCFRTCKEMVTNHGVTPKHIIPKTDKSRNVAKWPEEDEEEEGKSLSPVQFSGSDNFGLPQSDYLRGLIDPELEQGKPVIVGVNVTRYKDPDANLDRHDNANNATHHFVVIVGRSYDRETGYISYHFFDPGPPNIKLGTSEMNKLYVTQDFIIGGGPNWPGRIFVVTEVRSNQ